MSFEILKYFYFLCQPVLTANDLRASEGRETKALNCKPNTNLKEISELSNYCKTSGFRLHAVIFSCAHLVHQNTNCSHILLRVCCLSRVHVINWKFRFCTMVFTQWFANWRSVLFSSKLSLWTKFSFKPSSATVFQIGCHTMVCQLTICVV